MRGRAHAWSCKEVEQRQQHGLPVQLTLPHVNVRKARKMPPIPPLLGAKRIRAVSVTFVVSPLANHMHGTRQKNLSAVKDTSPKGPACYKYTHTHKHTHARTHAHARMHACMCRHAQTRTHVLHDGEWYWRAQDRAQWRALVGAVR
eukprot:366344-Chlamydomonas_euryale.AAC.9